MSTVRARTERRAGLPARAVAVLLALGTLCPPGAGRPERDADLSETIDRLLARQGAGDAAARTAAARELSNLPAEALPDVLAVLFHERAPGTAGAAPVLAPEQEELLCEVLRGWPARPVEEALVEHARGDLTGALRALELLGRTAAPRGVGVVLAIARDLAPVHQEHPRVAGVVASALESILARDPGAGRILAAALPETPRALLPALAAALGDHGRWIALRPLESLLDRDADLDRAVLRALGAWKTWDVAAPAAANVVAGYLDDRDPGTRTAAVIAAGRLRDWAAVPELVSLLEDGEPRVRRAALTALRGFGGPPLAADAPTWEAWYEAELEWREARSEEALRTARGPAPGRALRALRELARHPWFGAELSSDVAALLRQPSTPRALAACEALRAFGDQRSLLDLCAALEDPRPELAAAAARSLTAVTGSDPGPDAGAWRALLE